eukprot:ctg_204.g149
MERVRRLARNATARAATATRARSRARVGEAAQEAVSDGNAESGVARVTRQSVRAARTMVTTAEERPMLPARRSDGEMRHNGTDASSGDRADGAPNSGAGVLGACRQLRLRRCTLRADRQEGKHR